MLRIKNYIVLFLTLILFLSCSTQKHFKQPVKQISDLNYYSQNLFYYAEKIGNDSLLVSEEKQLELHQKSRDRFFKVWTDDITHESAQARNIQTYYQSQIQRSFKNPGIGENKLKRDSLFIYNLKNIADIDGSFNTMKKGMMLTYQHIRVLPTIKPFYLDFSLPGEGYPFDYWQNSTIPPGTPVFIYHENDNWALIDSHICSGWVPRNSFVYLSDVVVEQIIRLPQIIITKDKVPVFNEYNSYLYHADIGTVLPLVYENETFYETLFFAKNEFNYGVMIRVFINKNVSDKIPVKLTAQNIARISSEMMNQTYGWGGMYFNRDCSQSLLDLFIGFGVLLPRNGRQQAYNGGLFLDLKNLNPEIAKNAIIEKAIPFITLVRTPGHIMLYIGHEQNEPLVFHTVWGLRTIDENKNEGRHIIGKTVITSLDAGKELENINPDMTLINRLEGITFICP